MGNAVAGWLRIKAFNRTIEELKLSAEDKAAKTKATFNRTIEELKYFFGVSDVYRITAFNRTRVELKYISYQSTK